MAFQIRPESSEVHYQFFYKEPWFSAAEDKKRTSILKKVLKKFNLRLNDIDFTRKSPSDKFFSFYKIYDKSFLEVFFGLEEAKAQINRPISETQIKDLFSWLYNVCKEQSIKQQSISLIRHFSTEGNLFSYLDELNPKTPENFQEALESKGVIYGFHDSENELHVHIVVSNSIVVPNGLYLNTEFIFSPNLHDYKSAHKIAKEKYEMILNELNLQIANG